MAFRKKKSTKKRNRKDDPKTVINLEEQRERRRKERHAEAERKRQKRGVKSLEQQMLDEVAAEDLHVERAAINSYYTMSEAIANGYADATGRERQQPTGRRKRKKGMSIYMKIIIGVLIVVSIILAMSIQQIISLTIQEKEAESRLALLREEKEKLEIQTAQIGTDEAIEKQARDWLKMAKEGETLYIIGRAANAEEAAAAEGNNNNNK